MVKTYKDLLQKVENFKLDQNLDLSSGEDMAIGIMNLISIEEHLFFTSQKTGNSKYLDLLNEIRLMRTGLMKEIIKDYDGEVWCISKHLLAASMRIMEVGTKELKKAKVSQGSRPNQKAEEFFKKSYELYTLFWGLNLSNNKNLNIETGKINYLDEKGNQKGSVSVFAKLGKVIQKAIDCCRE